MRQVLLLTLITLAGAPLVSADATFDFNAASREYILSYPSAAGTLTAAGTLPHRTDVPPVTLSTQVTLEGAAEPAHTLAVEVLDASGDLRITVDFPPHGTMIYTIAADGTGQLESSTIPAGSCALVAESATFQALQEAFMALNLGLSERSGSPLYEEFASAVTLFGYFIMATDFGADCISVTRPQDNQGCDVVGILSCSPKGACCDVHDDCYADNGCTAASWACNVDGPLTFSARLALAGACLFGGGAVCGQCNTDVVECIKYEWPGESACCAPPNTCGDPRTNLQYH